MTVEPLRVDGRSLRSSRTHTAIIDAHCKLLREGHRGPTATHIATEAGVSPRTFFQHFPDVESLFLATWELVMDEVIQRKKPVDPSCPLPRRLDEVLADRSEIFHYLTPFALSLRARERVSPPLHQQQQGLMRLSLADLGDTFGAELSPLSDAQRELSLYALHTQLSWHAWHNLHNEVGLDCDKTLAVMRRGAMSVLTAHP